MAYEGFETCLLGLGDAGSQPLPSAPLLYRLQGVKDETLSVERSACKVDPQLVSWNVAGKQFPTLMQSIPYMVRMVCTTISLC